ncbi:hypothetical protein AAC691_16195 [Nguyenibacter vanlangensis]|uniref:Uncharacterized protein n=2 Tax=Nguyenibacter TaxID=1519186 RepID=A0A7Y7ITT2_9PROT|nr:hypothetical protein [Nguyenibacter vanlangensis]NVN10206.1 hypothetical protein [Nguyenibacter vanlangensis]
MADTTAASALASSIRQATVTHSHAAYRNSRPDHAAATGINVVSKGIDGSSSAMRFDATGQIIPTGTAHKAESAEASAVDLFA